MAARSGRARGGVIKTYARQRPLQRIEPQNCFSLADRQHLFSSSSSHLESSCDAVSCEDPDFSPKRKVNLSRRRRNRRPERRTLPKKKKSLQPPRKSQRKASSSTQSNSGEKENDEWLHPSSPVVVSTPFKFVTFRRKASGLGVTMKPLSSKQRKQARPLRSPDSLCDFKADGLRKKRRMCTDVTNLLSSSAEALPSPLQKPPLLSSTPSVMLTAVPRTGKAFVRQLALSEPLEDSIVICSADSESFHHTNKPQSEVIISHEERRNVSQASGEERGKNAMEFKTPRADSLEKESFGSGVKRLIIKTSSDRKLPSVCLLSPVLVSSPESQSVVFIDEGKLKSGFQEHNDDVLDASAELFSSDFTSDNEGTAPAHQVPHCSSNSTLQENKVLVSRRSSWYFSRFSPNKWKYFRRKHFQPFVRLNSQIVTEYFQQRSKDRNKSSDIHPDVLVDTNGVTALVMERCRNRRQPVVSLDSAAVSTYLLKKDEASKELENTGALPRNEDSAVLALGCRSPISQTIKTPQVTTSVLKTKMQNSVAPQTIGTGRKVCISGFSAKRWGTLRKKTATKTQQQLCFQDRSREDLGVGDTHSSSLLFSSSLLTSSFLNSTAVMNLNLSTESLTARDPQKDHQRWARLRAALSLHRRKKVEAGSPSSCLVERRSGGRMLMSPQNSSLLLLSPFQSSLCTHELTDAEKVLAECQQDEPIPFYQCLTRDQLRCCQKVGEGVYGEVFRTLRGEQHVALKVIPIEGSQKVNGEHQKSFAEILPEIIISKELSLLSDGEENQTSGFIQLHSAHCVQGSYPPELLSAWDTFAEEKGTENERPDLFGPEQLFMILEFEFGGEDLERISSKLPSVAASRSILHQVTAALAVAEEELRFEHRDLHWGNLLIEKSPSCTMSISLNGEIFDIPNAGIQVKIIDYTLSRLDKDGLTVFCDLSTDEELFLGEGDLQFDVYRMMRQENQNVWSSYKPHSNVLWLHYLCDKLLSEVKYIKKPTSAPQRRELRRLQDFRREVRHFGSATEVLKRSSLFR
ncbi:serine/threonine-protein kinase haspin [Bufo bufo]|uniref:serine/threonine-protein kinase haspin n=1 Tax=Bufo bufo TaxID=8384 RepID=UPI001ABDDD92|nr:serine/threonine-protein kinase haspin [Bufo bufo]